MTRNAKYILPTTIIILIAPWLTLLFKPYSQEIALATLLIITIITFFFFKGMPKEQLKPRLKKRMIQGLIVAIFSIALLIYEQSHPQFLYRLIEKFF